MAEVSLKPVIEKLESLFSKFNERFFNNELKTPVITVSPDTTKGAYGWCTLWRAWSNAEPKTLAELITMSAEEMEKFRNEGFYEINVCAEHLSRPFLNIAETMLHEMVHLDNVYKGIKDNSRGGMYHNKKFKETAEQHGLEVEKDDKYGWCKTTLNPEAKKFVEMMGDEKFTLHRRSALKGVGGSSKSKQSTRKYVCPVCGCIIRATKEVHVICGDCGVEFEEAV